MAEPRRIALLVEYDGTAFSGSQAQPAARTVQGTIESALLKFTSEAQRVRFAGRTDAGVHAVGQVVTLDTRTVHAPVRFVEALNHFLPQDVAVRSACAVATDFDPRHSARSRSYRYVIEHGRKRSPLTARTAWQREAPLDLAAMSTAAALLPRGRRDWAAFAGPVPDDRSTVRTLLRLEVRPCGPHRLEVYMEADAFLPHQVRRTMGALERVGTGHLTPQAFARLVDQPAATVGPAAPPQGLTLMAVRYEARAVSWETVDWDDNEDVPPQR